MNLIPARKNVLSMRRVLATWWPLAISWTLLFAEPWLITAVVARLPDANIHLAAYGSISFAIIGIIQAPVLSFLSFSTSMSRDLDSFIKGRRLMYIVSAIFTAILVLVAYTPLYDVIVVQIIGSPPEIVEPARWSMMAGIPWIFAVAYRRFHQGVMIRFNHSRIVSIGTMWRFVVDGVALVIAYTIYRIPGAVVATLMMVGGVVTEAVYVKLKANQVVRYEIKNAVPVVPPLQIREMVMFFIPLAATPLLSQLVRPIGSLALSRMPEPLETLALWPVVSGLASLVMTPGIAMNEVVIALLDQPGAKRALRRFMYGLMMVQLFVMLLLTVTPLSQFWFEKLAGLSPELAQKASTALWLLLPVSVLSPLNSWYNGVILHARFSRGVTESVVIYLVVNVLGLWLGGLSLNVGSLQVAIVASVLASMSQTLWMRVRSRKASRALT